MSDSTQTLHSVTSADGTSIAYDRLGDWERVIASHFAGEGEQAGPKSDWTKVPGYDYNQNPSIRQYVDGVLGHIEEADPSMFGGHTLGTTTAAAVSTAAVTNPAVADPTTAAAGAACFTSETRSALTPPPPAG